MIFELLLFISSISVKVNLLSVLFSEFQATRVSHVLSNSAASYLVCFHSTGWPKNWRLIF